MINALERNLNKLNLEKQLDHGTESVDKIKLSIEYLESQGYSVQKDKISENDIDDHTVRKNYILSGGKDYGVFRSGISIDDYKKSFDPQLREYVRKALINGIVNELAREQNIDDMINHDYNHHQMTSIYRLELGVYNPKTVSFKNASLKYEYNYNFGKNKLSEYGGIYNELST